MKRKLIFALGILLFFGFVSVNSFAQSSTNDQRIVGTWVGGVAGPSRAGSETPQTTTTLTIVFNANGSGTCTFSSGQQGTFTYCVSITGEIIFLEKSGESGRMRDGKIYFSPDGKILYFETGLLTVFRKK